MLEFFMTAPWWKIVLLILDLGLLFCIGVFLVGVVINMGDPVLWGKIKRWVDRHSQEGTKR